MIEAASSLSPSGPWLRSAASSIAVSCPSLCLHHRHFRRSKKTFQVSSIRSLTAYQEVAPPFSSSALTTPTRHKWRWLPIPEAQVIKQHPPIRVGVVFSGRQSPGGHNVVWGIYDAMKAHNPQSVLLGFVGGTGGLFAKKTFEITDDALSSYKSQGLLIKSAQLSK